ncbi:MAG: AAA family ATPase [Caldilineaceae bacterium]|nr:AAA family ATPase [Caldilineaceae bacterium]
MPPHLQISLLGRFQLSFGSAPVAGFAAARLQALLAYLVLHCRAPHSRQQLAFHFWPVSSESQARTNLRKLLLQLRQQLPAVAAFLIADNQQITWRTDAPFTCDVLEVEQILAQLRTKPLDQALLTALFEHYRGELLPTCYDDWILPLRTELHQAVMAALERLVPLLENQRAYAEGIHYAQRLLLLDPLEEKSYQQLMRLRAATGDRTGALRVYQECVQRLEQELGVEPAPATVALYEQLRHPIAPTAVGSPALFPGEPIPLIGRHGEWQLLQLAWQRARRGQPGLVIIAGEAGIGKTRLAEEMLHWAGQQGILAVRTRSYQTHGALAYAPIVELLQAAGIRQRLPRLNENQLSHVARLLPALLAEHPNLPPPQPLTESWQQQHFLAALGHAILADRQPVVLLFDDLQWADSETLTWLHFLLRMADTAPLLIVGTIRTGEVSRTHPLATLLAVLRRDDLLTELALAPLDRAEVQALAQAVQAVSLSTAALTQLYADSAGNPLFVVELLRAQQAAIASLTTDANPSGLPPKLYSVIRQRLAQLAPATQRVVNLAAAIGRSFTYPVLLAATVGAEEMGEEDIEEAVVDALDELLARQLIREQGAECYDFSHDRIRDVAYNEISQTRRRLLHRRVAEALEQIYQETPNEVCGRLAEHYEQAKLFAKAVDYLQRAGELAMAQFANSAAIDYFSRALALLTTTDALKRLELLLAREQVYYFLGRLDAQQADLMAIQALVDEKADGDPGRFSPSARLLAVFHMRMANWYAATGDYINAVQVAQAAVRLARTHGDHLTESEAFCRCGIVYFEQGNLPNARAVLRQALASARTVNSRMHIAEALNWLSAVGMFTGAPYAEIINYLQEALDIHRDSGNLRGEMNIHHKMAYALIAQGEDGYAQAIDHIEAGLSLSHRLNTPVDRGQLLRNLGWLYIYTGDYNKADAALHQSITLLQETNVTFAATAHAYLGFYSLQSGHGEAAEQLLKRALAGYRTVEKTRPHRTIALYWLGLLHIYRAEFAVALAYGEQALQAAEPRGDRRHMALAHTLMGHAWLGLNEFAAAQQNYQAAKALAFAMEQYNRSLEPMAGLAAIALQQGKLSEARAIVEEILSQLETRNLDRTEEALQIYRVCYQVLQALADSRSSMMLQAMYAHLQARAATIADPTHQQLFWEAMPGHREILTAIRKQAAN